MGYDISNRFSATEERDNMFSFLEKHYDLVQELRKYDQFNSRPMGKGEDLAYVPKKFKNRLIGFGGTNIDFSLWSLCAWMAVKSKYRFKKQPIIYYDTECFPVIITETWVDSTHIQVNSEGVVIERILKFYEKMLPCYYNRNYRHEIQSMTSINKAWLKFNE